MKKYVKPAIHCEDLSLAPVLTLTCDTNVSGLETTTTVTGNGYSGPAYVNEWGDHVFMDNPCAILNADDILHGAMPTFTNEMDSCHYKYNCYHIPDDNQGNTLFGS